MTSLFQDSKEHPIIIRVRGENHDATTPVTRTAGNHESVLVAHSGNCAVRIAVDGYRVFKRTRPDYWSTYSFAGVTWMALPNKSAVSSLLDTLQSEGVFNPAEVAAVKELSAAWPESANVAWTRLHTSEASPAFAPHITAAHRRYMQGV